MTFLILLSTAATILAFGLGLVILKPRTNVSIADVPERPAVPSLVIEKLEGATFRGRAVQRHGCGHYVPLYAEGFWGAMEALRRDFHLAPSLTLQAQLSDDEISCEIDMLNGQVQATFSFWGEMVVWTPSRLH